MPSRDPTDVRVLVVTTDDLVTALEANVRRDAGAVLRATPPFAGRMRVRLHLAGAEREYGDPAPLHVPPERFLDEVPPFPTPDDTADALRADPDASYSRERHRRRHETAVAEWRRAVRDAVLDRTTIETPAGAVDVEVATLE